MNAAHSRWSRRFSNVPPREKEAGLLKGCPYFYVQTFGGWERGNGDAGGMNTGPPPICTLGPEEICDAGEINQNVRLIYGSWPSSRLKSLTRLCSYSNHFLLYCRDRKIYKYSFQSRDQDCRQIALRPWQIQPAHDLIPSLAAKLTGGAIATTQRHKSQAKLCPKLSVIYWQALPHHHTHHPQVSPTLWAKVVSHAPWVRMEKGKPKQTWLMYHLHIDGCFVTFIFLNSLFFSCFLWEWLLIDFYWNYFWMTW